MPLLKELFQQSHVPLVQRRQYRHITYGRRGMWRFCDESVSV